MCHRTSSGMGGNVLLYDNANSKCMCTLLYGKRAYNVEPTNREDERIF